METGYLFTNEGDKIASEFFPIDSPHSMKRMESEIGTARTNLPSFLARADSKEDGFILIFDISAIRIH